MYVCYTCYREKLLHFAALDFRMRSCSSSTVVELMSCMRRNGLLVCWSTARFSHTHQVLYFEGPFSGIQLEVT